MRRNIPLCVFPTIFHEAPTEADVVGAVSLIIWTLSAILITKYALIVIRADDNGQVGGMLFADLAPPSSIRRWAGWVWFPLILQSCITVAAIVGGQWTAAFPCAWSAHGSAHSMQVILVLVVFGVGAIMGDGVLTPAISIVSAIDGVQTSFRSVTGSKAC
eukprot:jgi/Astpho2/6290/e_gw1.00089.20.1_t